MPDREKVIKGLELCTNISQDGCLMLCPYKDEKDETYSGFCEQVLKQDALDLLKDQEDLGTELMNAVELIHKKNERIEKLLKEQETANIYKCPYCGTWISAENVVRCKDCKHYMTIHCTCDGCCISDDWFCADGERKEGR